MSAYHPKMTRLAANPHTQKSPGEPGKLVYGNVKPFLHFTARGNEGGGDKVQLVRHWCMYHLYKAPNKSTPPAHQYFSLSTGQMPFLQSNQQCQSTEGKMANVTHHCNILHIMVNRMLVKSLITAVLFHNQKSAGIIKNNITNA